MEMNKPGLVFKKLIQPAAFLLLAFLLWHLLTQKAELPLAWEHFWSELHTRAHGLMALALLLMPFNWLAESEKWRGLLLPYYHFGRLQSIKAVCAGVYLSLFTPNRIGEYGGRVLFLPAEHRWKSVFATLAGTLAQWIFILSLGLVGMAKHLRHIRSIDDTLYIGMLVLAAATALILSWAYFNMKSWTGLTRKLPFQHYIKRFVKEIAVLSQFSILDLRKTLAWAGLRFAIYATQYVLVLYYFKLDILVSEAFYGVFALFLVQTSIPLPPISGLLARGNLALLIWGSYGLDPISCLSASFLLWIINLILPSLFGILVLKSVPERFFHTKTK
jgi:hypothetical protein